MTDREEQPNVDIENDTPPWERQQSVARAPEPEASSPLAKELEQDGTLADLSARQTVERRQAEDEAQRGSSKALLGQWDTLDDKGKADWIKGEKDYSKSAQAWWQGLADTIADPSAKNLREAGLKADEEPTWLQRKIKEQVAFHKQRQQNADLMEMGVKDGPQSGTARLLADTTAHGVVDGVVANMMKGIAYAGAAVESIKGYDWHAPDDQSPLKIDATPMGKVEERALYKAGKDVSDWADARFPKDPARSTEFKAQFGEGLGSMVGFMGPTAAMSLARAGLEKAGVSYLPTVIAAINSPGISAGATGALAQAGSMTDDALKAYKDGKTVDGHQVDENDILAAFLLSVPIGATEAAPIAHLFHGQKGAWIKRIFAQAYEEGGQEFVQQVAENVTARAFYDDKRQWDDNAWDGMAIGGLLGAKSQIIADTYRYATGKDQEGEPAPGAKPVKEAKVRSGATRTDAEPTAAPSAVEKPAETEKPSETKAEPYDVKQFYPQGEAPVTEEKSGSGQAPGAQETGAPISEPAPQGEDEGVHIAAMVRKPEGPWTYQASEPTPTVDQLPEGTFTGTQSDWEKLSPGMRREIARAAAKISAPAIAVGDEVQWTSAGADQFKEPAAVKALSPDGKWAFVEGSNTGIPVAELTKAAPAWQRELSAKLAEIAKPLSPAQQAKYERAVDYNLAGFHADIEAAYTEHGLDVAELSDEDVKSVAFHMAQGLTAEEALERYAVEKGTQELAGPQETVGGESASTDAGRAGIPPAGSTRSQPAAARATGAGTQSQGPGRAGSTAGPAAQQPGGSQRGVREGARGAEPGPAARDYERALRASFSSIIAGKSHRSTWAKQLFGDKAAATPENVAKLKELIGESVDAKKLFIDRNGVLKRTKLARVAPRETRTRPLNETLSIPPDVRVTNAVRLRETETGKAVDPVIRNWADRIEAARGTDAFDGDMAILRDAAKKGQIDRAKALELAHLVGYRPKAKTSKAEALDSIQQRHDDLAKYAKVLSEGMPLFSFSSRIGGPFERIADRVKAKYMALGFPGEAVTLPESARELMLRDQVRSARRPDLNGLVGSLRDTLTVHDHRQAQIDALREKVEKSPARSDLYLHELASYERRLTESRRDTEAMLAEAEGLAAEQVPATGRAANDAGSPRERALVERYRRALAGPILHAIEGGKGTLAERESAARKVMESPEWKAAAEKPADVTRDTSKAKGYGSPEWLGGRKYIADGKEITGFHKAVDHLAKAATDAVPGGVAKEKKAYIVIGYPGAGKSTIGEALSKTYKAARVVGDDNKAIIPEYEGGKNNGGVKKESDRLAAATAAKLAGNGTNLVLETSGTIDNVGTRIDALKARGYTVGLIHVEVPKAIAMERAVERYKQDGRPVPVDIYDALNPGATYEKVKAEGKADETATVAWQEGTQGQEGRWALADGVSNGLEGLRAAFQQSPRGELAGGGRPRGAELRPGDEPGSGGPELAAFGDRNRAVATLEPGEPSRDFLDGSFTIHREGEEIGQLHFALESNKSPDDTAYIHWIEMAPGQHLSMADVRAIRENFRQYHPTVTQFEGERVSGARQHAEDSFQSVVMAALADGDVINRPYKPDFIKALPEWAPRLEAQLRRTLPEDVAVRMADRLFIAGVPHPVVQGPTRVALDAVTHMPRSREEKWLIEIALDGKGFQKTLEKGAHEVTHVLRERGMWSDAEWRLLVERANKVGMEGRLSATRPSQDAAPKSSLELYREHYRDWYERKGWKGPGLERRVNELVDQELVASMVEDYVGGKASFGTTIDGLLARIAKFFEALRNALHGLGFRTADDVLEQAFGDAARKPVDGGERIEPTFGMAPEMMAISPKGQRLGAEGTAAQWINRNEKAAEDWQPLFKSGLPAVAEIAEKRFRDTSSPEATAEAAKTELGDYLERQAANPGQLNPHVMRALERYEEDPEAATKQIEEYVSWQRKQTLDQWRTYLTETNAEYAADPFWRDYVWQGLLKPLRKESPNLPPPLLPAALGEVYLEIKAEPDNRPFHTVYAEAAADEALNQIDKKNKVEIGDAKTWVKVPRTSKDHADFDKNTAIVRSLSCDTWCTSGSLADQYIQTGDFWMLTEAGETRMAIRFDGDKVAEIQGQSNDGRIPAAYAQDVRKLADSGEITLSAGTKRSLDDAIARAAKLADAEAAIKANRIEDAFGLLGVKVASAEGGFEVDWSTMRNLVDVAPPLRTKLLDTIAEVTPAWHQGAMSDVDLAEYGELPNLRRVNSQMYIWGKDEEHNNRPLKASFPRLEEISGGISQYSDPKAIAKLKSLRRVYGGRFMQIAKPSSLNEASAGLYLSRHKGDAKAALGEARSDLKKATDPNVKAAYAEVISALQRGDAAHDARAPLIAAPVLGDRHYEVRLHAADAADLEGKVTDQPKTIRKVLSKFGERAKGDRVYAPTLAEAINRSQTVFDREVPAYRGLEKAKKVEDARGRKLKEVLWSPTYDANRYYSQPLRMRISPGLQPALKELSAGHAFGVSEVPAERIAERLTGENAPSLLLYPRVRRQLKKYQRAREGLKTAQETFDKQLAELKTSRKGLPLEKALQETGVKALTMRPIRGALHLAVFDDSVLDVKARDGKSVSAAERKSVIDKLAGEEQRIAPMGGPEMAAFASRAASVTLTRSDDSMPQLNAHKAHILRGGRSVGEVTYGLSENGRAAHIHYIETEDGHRLSVADVRSLREAFRALHPAVTRFEGDRWTSGSAKANADNSFQSVEMASFSSWMGEKIKNKFMGSGEAPGETGKRTPIIEPDQQAQGVGDRETGSAGRREGSLNQTSTPNLDLSPEARKARAAEMGFDTSKVWYHGTISHQPFDAFDLGKVGSANDGGFMGRGIYLTDDPKIAKAYTLNNRLWRDRSGGKRPPLPDEYGHVMQVYVRGKVFEMDPSNHAETVRRIKEIYPEFDGSKGGTTAEQTGPFADAMQAAGYAAVREPQHALIVFDPSNIRSVNATFDPAQESSPLLMAAFKSSTPQGPTYDPRAPGLGHSPKSITQIIADLKEALGMVTTQGLVGLTVRNRETGYSRRLSPQGNVAGQYQTPAGVARIRASTDIDAIAHEGGHHLENVIGQPLQDLIAQHAAELSPLAGNVASAQNPSDPGWLSEGFAEFFRDYILKPGQAAVSAPGFYQAFEDLLDAERPGLLEDLDKLQINSLSKDYQDYIKATAVERLVADVGTNRPPTMWDRIKEFYKTDNKAEVVDQWLSSASFNLSDMTNPSLKLKQALLRQLDASGARDEEGRPISLRLAEDPQHHQRMLPQAFKVGHQLIVNGITSFGELEATGPTLHGAMVEFLGGRDRFAWTDEKIATFQGYLEAQRAVVEWARKLQDPEITRQVLAYYGGSPEIRAIIAEGPREGGRSPYRKSFEEYWQALQDIEKGNPRAKSAAAMARDWQHRLLTLEHEAGLWTDEEYRNLSRQREFYVPNQRDFSDVPAVLQGIQAAPAAQSSFQKAKPFVGSDRNIIGALETMALRAYTTAEAIQRNEVARAFAELSDRVPQHAKIVERIETQETLPADERTFAKLTRYAVGMGMDPQDAAVLVREMEAHLSDAEVQLIYNPQHLGPKRGIIMPFWEKGERKLIRFNDVLNGSRLLAAMNEIGRAQSDILTRVVSFPAQVLRAGVVMHPAYIMANIIGDMQNTLALTGAPPVWSHFRGAWHELSSYPKFRSGLQKLGITPSDVAQMQDRIGLIAGGQVMSDLQQARGRRSGIELTALRNKGYEVFDIRALAGLGTAVTGGVVGAAVGAGAGAALSVPGAVIGAVLGRKAGGIPGAMAGALGGASVTGAVVGATLGVSVGAMMARLVFGQGALATFAKFSELSETFGRRGVAEWATKRAKAFDPSMSDVDAIREGVFTANDTLPFDRRGFQTGAMLRIVPFLSGNLQGVGKVHRQAWMIEGERGRIATLPMVQGGLLGGAGTVFGGAMLGLPAGPIGAAIGAAAGAGVGWSLYGKADMEKLKVYLRYALTRTAASEQAMKETMSIRDQKAMRDGMRVWMWLSLIGLAGAALAMLYKDDPEHDDIRTTDDQTKYNHWVFKAGGVWYRLKRFEFGYPAIVTEAAFDLLYKGDPRVWEKLRDGFLASHTPPIIPQVLNLQAALRTGVDPKTGRPIVPDYAAGLSASRQRGPYTSAFANEWATALHAAGIQVSPYKIDYALQTELAYWGREVKVDSDFLTGKDNRAPKLTDWPMVGTMVNRFTLDPSRRSESIREYWKLAGKGQGPYATAAKDYDDVLKAGSEDGVKAFLAGLKPEERIYAVLDKHFKPVDKEAHPLNRARAIFTIDQAMQREMAMDRLVSTQPGEKGETIPLSPAKRVEVDDILGRLSAIEVWNALHDIGRPGWEKRARRDPQPVLDELKGSSEKAFDEMMQRRTKAKVGTDADDQEKWTDVKDRVESLIQDDDMLGMKWEKTVKKRKGPTPSLTRTPNFRQPVPDDRLPGMMRLGGPDIGAAGEDGARMKLFEDPKFNEWYDQQRSQDPESNFNDYQAGRSNEGMNDPFMHYFDTLAGRQWFQREKKGLDPETLRHIENYMEKRKRLHGVQPQPGS